MLRPLLAASLFAVVLSAQGWVDRTPGNPLASPSPRRSAAMCWDEARGYVLLFGGQMVNSAPPNDTFSWNGTSWTLHNTPTSPYLGGSTGQQPLAMTFHAPTGEAVLVAVGGTYTWSGSNWLNIAVAIGNGILGIPSNVALARDPVLGQTVLFVGSRVGSGFPISVSETYVWDGFSWSPRPTPTRPFPVETPSLAFDAAAGKLLLSTNGSIGSTFWEWTGTNWQQRLYAPAPSAAGATAADTAHNRVVMFDGTLNNQPNHTWTFANGVASQLGTPVEPARRANSAMAFDPVRGRIVLFGGFNGLDLGDTWEFEFGAGASYAIFGAGCAGSRGVPVIGAQGSSLPRIGESFSLHIGNLPVSGPVFLFLGLSNSSYGGLPLPLPLGPFGAPGCNVLCSGDALYLLPNVVGTSVWSFPMPATPGLTFFNQAFAIDPGVNALGLTASNGGQGVIGM